MTFSGASLAFLLFLGACSSDEPATGGSTTVTAPTIELTAPASRAAVAVQDFNIDFFRNVALYDDYKGKNVACSPMSATMLLSLLSNAASDETAAEIAAVLGYSDRNDLNELYATLATKLPSLDSKATLSFANSVWYHKEYTLTDNFSSIAKEYYKADIFKRDLSGKTIVTTESIKAIAENNGIKMYDCYTGFKWIAAVIRELETKDRYLGGGEESYGFLAEDFCRDKDSVSAISLMAEICAWAKDRGMDFNQMLQEIYLKNGYSHEEGISVVRPGKTGADEIQQMMVNFRANPPKEIDGSKLTCIKDYSNLTCTDTATGDISKLDFPAAMCLYPKKPAKWLRVL